MKRLFTLLTIALIASSLAAQVGELRNNLAVGFNAGYNLSSVDFSPTIKQGLQPGYAGGLTLRYTSEKYFSLICAAQLELNFAQRGWNETIDDGTNNTYSRTTNYIEIPFFAHLGWGEEERGMQFFVNAGPQIGLFLNDSEHYGFTQEDPWNTNWRPNNIIQQYGKAVENRLEYGIAGGLGMELKSAIGNFDFAEPLFFPTSIRSKVAERRSFISLLVIVLRLQFEEDGFE